MGTTFSDERSDFSALGISSESYSMEEFKLALEEKLESPYLSPDSQRIQTPSIKPSKPTLQGVHRISVPAQLIEGENECINSAFDGRKQILKTAEWPNSVHGVVIFKTKNMITWGTGVLIGPHVVLTAGHNLYNYDAKKYVDVKSLQFLPGMNGQLLPFDLVEVENYFVSPRYVQEKKEDYGVLILKQPIGKVTGYFGLACLEPEEIQTKTINVTGYPGDKVVSKPNHYEMWGMEGTVSRIDKDKSEIHYLIDTSGGQSGSGVWYQEGENFYVCGVHVSGELSVNRATLLTRDAYRQIHTWIHQANSRALLFKLKKRNELSFSFRRINFECLTILMKYNLDDLRFLNLPLARIGEKGAQVLAKNTSWINLSILCLPGNSLGTKGAKALATNTSWINLSELNLHHNNIENEGAKALATNISWVNLSYLNLESNNVDKEGVEALATNTSWINLSKLDLHHNHVEKEGAKAGLQNIHWVKLSSLSLSENGISTEEVKELMKNTLRLRKQDFSIFLYSSNNRSLKKISYLPDKNEITCTNEI